MAHYVPATFGLYEFDDDGRPGAPVRRWFSSFNGLIGTPPQNVTLGWSDGDATVLVRTDDKPPWHVEDARNIAAHVALGGDELSLAQRPASALDTHGEMTRIATAHELWIQTPGVLPGGPDAETISWGEFSLGWASLGQGAVYLAAVGLTPDRFRLREVPGWADYDVDASTSFPLSALDRPR